METLYEIKVENFEEALTKAKEAFEKDDADMCYITIKRVFGSYWVEVEDDSERPKETEDGTNTIQ